MTRATDSLTPSTHLQTLQWQFELTWKLAQYHLPSLTDAACLWEPAPGSWTVRQSDDGQWRPDWVEPEPNPAPPVTIGWLTWHLVWWWSGLLAAVRNEPPIAREEVNWPGSAQAVVARLERLSKEWAELLSSLRDRDLENPCAYPWTEPRPLRLTLAWTNSELMKNIAEIGTLRHLCEASQNVSKT